MPSSAEGAFTFLFTDIEGSTRLWADQTEAMNQALATHDRLLREAITAHGGHVFKTVGDAFCAAFEAADAAVAAALALQRAVAEESWPDGTPIRVRAALHTGPCYRRDDDYFGPTLNRTARVLGVADGGQTLLTDAVNAALAGRSPAGASLRPLGSVRLKDLAEPAQVYQLDGQGLPSDFRPLRSLDSLPTNLPSRTGLFVGRADAVRDLAARCLTTPVLTLVGPGGIGKTSLALQVAAEALDELPDGAWLVDLAPAAGPEEVPGAVALALGLGDEPGRTLEETLGAWLQSRQLLLVLDNCEHVVAECARLVSRWSAAGHRLRILATSREPLNVSDEVVWRVPPLSLAMVDGPAAGEAASEAAASEAVQLFVSRARSAHPEFELNDENAAAVVAICRKLDGIPLAIELAAARVRVLPPDGILQRLDDRFRLLTGGRRDGLPRHQTLRATIDWSYELLSQPERLLLARLAVFRGAWPLEAAESICADEALDALDVLDLAGRLVERSLVSRAGDPADARFRLLESIRQYAREKMEEGGDWNAVQARHITWYRDLARQGDAGLKGSDQAKWLDRLATEHDDLGAALDRAVEAGDSVGALSIGASMWRFWHLRGHLSDGRRRLGAALESAGDGDAGDAAGVAQGGGAGAAEGPAADLLADALHGAGTLAGYQGDYGAARTLHERSLARRRAAGDAAGEAASLNNLAIIAFQEGQYAAARELYEASLVLKRSLGDQRGIANSLNNLALIAKVTGDLGDAMRLYEETLALYQALGDSTGVAQTNMNCAAVAIDRGEYDLADTHLAEGLENSERNGDRQRTALARFLQGRAAYCRERLSEARDLLSASMAEHRALGDQPGVWRCQIHLGQVMIAAGEAAAAIPVLRESLAGQEALGDRHGMADTLCYLGCAHRAIGNIRGARRDLIRGLVRLDGMGRMVAVIYALEWLAGAIIADGDDEVGLALLGTAAQHRSRLGVPAEPHSFRLAASDKELAWGRLGESIAAAAWSRGEAMDYAISVALAMNMASDVNEIA